jgi:hypothetical protein
MHDMREVLTKGTVVNERQTSVSDLLNMLAEGWAVQPPIYRMPSPFNRRVHVYRMVLWRDGRPRVASVGDSAEMRRFVADHGLKQESL